MSEKTKTGKIPSIEIDKNFLKKMGEIIEQEIKLRIKEAQEKIDFEIAKRTQEINNPDYYLRDSQKEEAIESMKEHVRVLNKPNINANYTIDTKEEQITFDSIEEVLNTPFFPSNIKTFSVHIYHYKKEYVSLSLTIQNPHQVLWGSFGGGRYSLSSENEGKILKVEQDLHLLFSEYQNSYQRFLYPSKKYFYLIIFYLSLIFSCAANYLIYTNLPTKYFSLLPFSLGIAYYFMSEMLIWLFPFYNYSLVKRKKTKDFLRIVLSIILMSVISSAVYDLISSAF